MRVVEEDNSIKVFCNEFTNREELKRFLTEKVRNLEEQFDQIFNFNFNNYFNVIINNYDGVILLIVNSPNGDNQYCLFDGNYRMLSVNKNQKNINYVDESGIITSELLEKDGNSLKISGFINYLGELNDIIPFNFDSMLLCNNLRIFDDKNNTIIIDNDEFILARPNFYKKNFHKINVIIVMKKGFKVVGSMECYLNELEDSNFAYKGNVAINIYHEFAGKGYEQQALNLLKEYVEKIPENINKDLFIAGTLDDGEVEQIAINNGGSLFYRGDVPKSDPLSFLGKVRKVKIYKIG